MTNTGWIGVDLDGTLAFYNGWQGPSHIGDPIPLMEQQVKLWLHEGVKVKIFTARASDPDQVPIVEDWLVKHGFGKLPVTNQKDYGMIALYDDRAFHVIPNEGVIVMPKS